MTGVWVLTYDYRLIDLAGGCYIIPFQESVKALVSSGPDWETLCLCENMEQAKSIVVRIAREIGAVDVADLNNLEEGAQDAMISEHKGRLLRLPDTSPGIAYWNGALEAGLRECAKLEAALGLPHGVHISLYYRLEQWRDLLNTLEEVTEGDDSS